MISDPELAKAAKLQKRVRRMVRKTLPEYGRVKANFFHLHRKVLKKETSWARAQWQRYYKVMYRLRRLAKRLFKWQEQCRHLGHPIPPQNESQSDAHCPGCHYSKSERFELRNAGVFG